MDARHQHITACSAAAPWTGRRQRGAAMTGRVRCGRSDRSPATPALDSIGGGPQGVSDAVLPGGVDPRGGVVDRPERLGRPDDRLLAGGQSTAGEVDVGLPEEIGRSAGATGVSICSTSASHGGRVRSVVVMWDAPVVGAHRSLVSTECGGRCHVWAKVTGPGDGRAPGRSAVDGAGKANRARRRPSYVGGDPPQAMRRQPRRARYASI